MSDATGQPKPRIRLWLRVVLGVSLALNLLVLGLVGGAMMRFGGPDGMRPLPRTIGAALFRELPRADRRALSSRSRGSLGDHQTRRSANLMSLGDALRASPFDPEAVGAVLDQHAAARARVQKSVQQAWLAQVSTMSDEARQAYATRLERVLNRPWAGRHRSARD